MNSIPQTTLEASGEQAKTTLETSGEDAKRVDIQASSSSDSSSSDSSSDVRTTLVLSVFLNLLHPFRVYFWIFSTRFECSFQSDSSAGSQKIDKLLNELNRAKGKKKKQKATKIHRSPKKEVILPELKIEVRSSPIRL